MTFIKPTDDHLSEPFWQHLAQGRLCLERCSACQTFRYPPGPICPACHSFESEWVETKGEASLYSFTVVHHAVHPSVESWLPYAVGLATLAESVRLVGRIRTDDLSALCVEMPVKVVVERQADDFALPVFEPLPDAGR